MPKLKIEAIVDGAEWDIDKAVEAFEYDCGVRDIMVLEVSKKEIKAHLRVPYISIEKEE